jgi:hypothetical protein
MGSAAMRLRRPGPRWGGLPQRAPALLGTIERSADTLTFTPAGSVSVTVNGKEIGGPTTLQTKDKADKLRAGIFHSVCGRDPRR